MKKITEEQLDFLKEMVNIGAGHAASAFSQITGQPVDVTVPKVQVIAPPEVSSVFKKPSSPVACVRMEMVGDVTGSMFFIVPEKLIKRLAKITLKASHARFEENVDKSVIEEIGNIVAGTYLMAIHDFCRLNIFHTVPEMVIDMVQSIVDETIAAQSMKSENIILIENDFSIAKTKIMTYMLVIPSGEFVDVLMNSIEQARAAMER